MAMASSTPPPLPASPLRPSPASHLSFFSSSVRGSCNAAFFSSNVRSLSLGPRRSFGTAAPHFRMDMMEGANELQMSDGGRKIQTTTSRRASMRFRWNKKMSKLLIDFLVNQVSDNMKTEELLSKDSLVAAARAVSQELEQECDLAKVESQLKTLKAKWSRVEKLKALPSVSWDPVTKTINLREDEYHCHIQAHPRDASLLNRPIEDYDKLVIIFGDDQAALKILKDKDFVDDQHMDRTPNDEQGHNLVLKEGSSGISCDQFTGHCQHQQSIFTHAASANPSNFSSRAARKEPTKQKEANEDIHTLILKIGELVDAIKDLKPRDFADDLWKAITACGYNERMSITAFEYFLKNEVEGKIFLVRGPELRKEWLAKFFSSFL